MGLLQQEFIPVLQPSIQTADRYQVEKPRSWCAVFCQHVLLPMVFQQFVTQYVPFFFLFSICAYIAWQTMLFYYNIYFYFSHKLPVSVSFQF